MGLKTILEIYKESRKLRTQKHWRCWDSDTTDYHGVFLQFELWHYCREEITPKGEHMTVIDSGRWLPTDHTLKWMELIPHVQ